MPRAPLAAFFGPLKFDFGPRPRSKWKDSRSRSGRSNEELGCAGHEARSGRRLDQMSRRKSEITGHMNERDSRWRQS
jgi:hypothetical protein